MRLVAGGRDPAHHQRQAGSSSMPRRVSRRRVRRIDGVTCRDSGPFGQARSWVKQMTSIAEAPDRVVGLARGMRGWSRPKPPSPSGSAHSPPRSSSEMWASVWCLCSFNPVPQAVSSRRPFMSEMAARDLDRNGLAGRLVRLDRDCEHAIIVTRGLSARRRFRQEMLPPTTTTSPWAASSSRTGGERWCEGGYRLSGSWSFGSGTGHSEYVAAGFFPMDGDEMRWISEGVPDMQVAVVPRRGDLVQRRLVCAGAQGNRIL